MRYLPRWLVKVNPRDLVYVSEAKLPAHESLVITGTPLPGNRPRSGTIMESRIQMLTCPTDYLARKGDRKSYFSIQMLQALKLNFFRNPICITSPGLSSLSFRAHPVLVFLSIDIQDGLMGTTPSHNLREGKGGGGTRWNAGNGRKKEEVKKTGEDEEGAA